jgi:hypothetical protein
MASGTAAAAGTKPARPRPRVIVGEVRRTRNLRIVICDVDLNGPDEVGRYPILLRVSLGCPKDLPKTVLDPDGRLDGNRM